jgi:hypothetical protein
MLNSQLAFPVGSFSEGSLISSTHKQKVSINS